MNSERARSSNLDSNLDYLRSILTGALTPKDESPFKVPFPIYEDSRLQAGGGR